MAEPAGTVDDTEKRAAERRPPRDVKDWLAEAAEHINVAMLLESDELDDIGIRVVKEYEIDELSRRDWIEANAAGMDLAEQLLEEGEEGYANVKYPLITVAAIQFNARALPELLPGNDIVKAKIIGRDDDGKKMARGKRVSEHMSWQCLEEMEEWEEELDRLLMVLPIVGTYFKKTYYDQRLGRNASHAYPPDVIVVNFKAKSLETAPRITHICIYYLYEIYEFVQDGVWIDQPIRHSVSKAEENPDEDDQIIPHIFLEQHKRLDLDHDGYPEPYVITVHKETSKVVRIVANFDSDGVELSKDLKKVVRIEPNHHFTKFSFLPNMRSGIYDIGFGLLLYPLNDTCNTIIDQLIDSGTQQNLQAGFLGRGVRMKGGTIRLKQGEWKPVDTRDGDLRKSVLPLPVHEPSVVLFQLLGLLLDAAKDISSVKDVLTGEEPKSANVPATTVLMLVEQGTKVFNSIYKRIHRSLKQEFKKLYKLNSKFLKPIQYFRILDEQRAIKRIDYQVKDLDIVPVSDPKMATDVQRMAKAQALIGMSGRPNVDEDAITMRYLEAIGEPNPELILPPPDKRTPPRPDPKALEIAGKLEIESKKIALEIEKFKLEQVLTMAQIEKIRAQAIEHIAKAEKHEIGPQVEIYLEQVRQAGTEATARIQAIGAALGQKSIGAGTQPEGAAKGSTE